MRNILLLVVTITLLSCGASKTVRDSKKVIKGEWALNSINYSELALIMLNFLMMLLKIALKAVHGNLFQIIIQALILLTIQDAQLESVILSLQFKK